MTKTELKKELKKMYRTRSYYEKDKDLYSYIVSARVSDIQLDTFHPIGFKLDDNGNLIWVAINYIELQEKILKKRMRVKDDIVFVFDIGTKYKKRKWTLKVAYNCFPYSVYFEPIEEIFEEND